MVLLFVLCLSPLIEQIPLAALVGVMFVVAQQTFAWGSLRVFNKVPLNDAIVIVLVTVITVLTDLATAVLCGVVIAALNFAWQHARDLYADVHDEPDGSKLYRVHGSLFFASTPGFLKLFGAGGDPARITLDCRHLSFVDYSAIEALHTLRQDLEKARRINSATRLGRLQAGNNAPHRALLRAQDWAQVRPEWGLARNAALIVAPRSLSAALDLEGRCFLHSYDPAQDADGRCLTAILTAPMVVAQWICSQYLFSTLDNSAYGGGSKITKNITGKTGIMQGNASDLMTGLPLQSVYLTDTQAYHEPQRLMTVVYAPRRMLDAIIHAQPVLQKLFGNGWVQLACIEPQDHATHLLHRDLTWHTAN
jgi:hypothetical protein